MRGPAEPGTVAPLRVRERQRQQRLFRGAYYYGGSVSDKKASGGSFDKAAVDSGGFGCSRTGGG